MSAFCAPTLRLAPRQAFAGLSGWRTLRATAMGLDLRLQHKMSQQLVMTPQLQQAVKLLSLSHQEVADALREELAQNPLLEEREPQAPAAQPGYGEPVVAAEEPRASAELLHAALPSAPSAERRQRAGSSRSDGWAHERLATGKVGLQEHLVEQLRLMALGAPQRLALRELLAALDGDGYLPSDVVEEVAERCALHVADVAEALRRLQECDPVGVGARSLRECLLLQAGQLADAPAALSVLIDRFLPELASRKYAGIARALRLPVNTVVQLAREVARLQPRPGRAFDDEETSYVVPDLFVEATGHAEPAFAVWCNDEALPHLRIDPSYDAARIRDWPQQARAYVHDKLRSAQWLLRSVHMRQRTMLRVMRTIVQVQRAFFEEGPEALRPMVLRDVASELGMHESTISRVTTNKYVHTPHGTFELKFFFSSKVGDSSADGRASQSVRHCIARLIDNEDKAEPLSDQKIVDILSRQDIRIARRTVAKYRKMLNRRPSSSRRREV